MLGIEPVNEDAVIAQKLRLLKYADRIALMQILNSLTEEHSVDSDAEQTK